MRVRGAAIYRDHVFDPVVEGLAVDLGARRSARGRTTGDVRVLEAVAVAAWKSADRCKSWNSYERTAT